uniref:Nose resistant-to-fluoxetine protein N-terminal domain-containing protein n=1 Tax=Branchiostoma floridae TaxID=7739 RepID=C3Y323_BRAFL|eukprot:XP_002609425.1 hypothetical protein BRAFLDRAFT_124632 [Branchiostoma floridae]
MRLLLYICLCSAVVSLVRSQVIWGQAVPEATAQLNVLASLFRSRGLLQQKISDIVLDFSTVNWTDITIPAQPTGNISQQCQKDVAQYEADLFQGKTYAMQILDAAGKPPSGILNGNLFWVGSYSQCVNITRKGYNITFDGKFYLASLVPVARAQQSEQLTQDGGAGIPGMGLKLTLGVCVPNSCSQHDVIQRLDGSITGRVLLCFSLYTNIGKLLSTKQAPGSIKCLHGIRFISMTWVILGHTYIFGIQQFENLLEAFETVQTFTFQAIMNATVSVDTFFFLSGLLMSYLLLKQIGKRKENGKSVPYGMLYFHRYWRLTPTYMFVLMLYMWVLPYMFSGPFWPPAPLDPYCGENWWTNLLYVNNVVNDDRMCMGWTWYLANDMQFFVIGVPLVYILYRDMVHYYDKPYCRIGPYLVGVAVGWLLVKIKKKQTKSRTLSVLMLVGWLIAATAAMAVLYSVYGQYHGTTLQTQGENVLYLTVHRTVWAMAIGWVVIACYYGYGGVVDIILSWDAWVPLSRLTYCAYLIHILVMYAVYFTREVPIHYSTFTMIYFFLGHVTLSYGLAFLVSVAVEAPLMGLEKILFNK